MRIETLDKHLGVMLHHFFLTQMREKLFFAVESTGGVYFGNKQEACCIWKPWVFSWINKVTSCWQTSVHLLRVGHPDVFRRHTVITASGCESTTDMMRALGLKIPQVVTRCFQAAQEIVWGCVRRVYVSWWSETSWRFVHHRNRVRINIIYIYKCWYF